MGKNLVIVESPNKTKTISKYLGDNYKVVSSVGHIRDLSTSGKYGFGVDIENNFKPDYVPIKGKSKIIKELKNGVSFSVTIQKYQKYFPNLFIMMINVIVGYMILV